MRVVSCGSASTTRAAAASYRNAGYWRSFRERLPSVRRAAARVLRRRLPCPGRLALGSAGVAAAAAAPRLRAVARLGSRLPSCASPTSRETWRSWRCTPTGRSTATLHGLFGRLDLCRGSRCTASRRTPGTRATATGVTSTSTPTTRAYGAGWKHETAILLRKPSGAFCYSFWPTRDNSLPGYPNNRRPAGHGTRYRVTIAGPGATPDVVWEGPGVPDYSAGNPEHVAHERRMNDLLWSYGDRFCRGQL